VDPAVLGVPVSQHYPEAQVVLAGVDWVLLEWARRLLEWVVLSLALALLLQVEQ